LEGILPLEMTAFRALVGDRFRLLLLLLFLGTIAVAIRHLL
jgi:hypothetical protein